jgi:DNA polymerase-3 subunit delta
LIVEFYEDINDERKSASSAKDCTRSFAKKNGVDSCRFFKLNPYESLAVLKDIAREKNINIQDHTINHLLVLQDYDLGLCSSELDKLSLLEHEITNKDVDILSFNLSHITSETLVDNFFNKVELKSDIQRFLDEGGLERDLINALTTYITKLFEATIYMKIYGNFDARAVLGYIPPKQILDKIGGRAVRLDFEKYNEILSLLGELTLDISRITIDKASILISRLNKIQAIL